MNKGKFIVFEGCEGSGKSTQLELLANYLESKNIPVYKTKEPGGTYLGKILRHTLLHEQDINSISELLLYTADRANHVDIIKDCLDSGYWVLCDRFSWSTIAYQGYGRGQSSELIKYLNAVACQGLKPDWTILLDINPKVGLARKYKQGEVNKFEAEDIEFHNRVRNGYLTIFESVAKESSSIMFYCYTGSDLNKQVSPEDLHNKIVSTLPFSLC